ncbi:MAG: OmpA family protein [Myxococcales bacterium FL481]|nr:MAG: OmpA family protein [Myxococcales bacterium FL481]
MLGKLLLAPILALTLWADDPFRFEFASQTDARGEVYLVVHANETESGVEVRVEGDDGRVVRKVIDAKAGRQYRLTWKQSKPQVHYQVEIRGAELATDFSFDVRRAVAGGTVKAPTLLSSPGDIVDEHQARYKTSFTMTNYQFRVFNTDGEMVEDQLVTDKVVEAGETISLTWSNPDEVFLLQLRGEDEAGRYAEATHVPWSAEIPHTEVHFDSGKWDIKKDQEPQLDEAFAILVHELAGIDRANEAVKKNLQTQLYIVGYTDTVGSAGDNQKLSHNRARAIAQYFHDKGAWCEIYFAGMGERGLAVQTGDNVDQVQNRRARYLMGVDAAPTSSDLPRDWKLLAGARQRQLDTLPPLPQSYLDKKASEREARIAKFGGAGSSGSSADDDGDDPGNSNRRGGGDDDVDLDPLGDGGPPPVDGAPGGTAKGCRVAGSTESSWPGAGLGWAVLMVAAARRRRRRDGPGFAGWVISRRRDRA